MKSGPRSRRSRRFAIDLSAIGAALLLATPALPALAAERPTSSALRQMLDRRVDVDALLMLDATNARGAYSGDVDDGTPSALTVRRARAGVDIELSQRLDASLALDLDPDAGELEPHRLSLDYALTKRHALAVGLMKQPFGLENLSGSDRLRTLERSVASEVFAPERGLGVTWSFDGRGHYSSVGAFADRDDEARSIVARTTWAPIDDGRELLHLGANLARHERDGENRRLRDEGGIAHGRNLVRSARLPIDSDLTSGIELASAYGPVSIQGEWFVQRAELADRGVDARFDGAYVQAGWVLADGYRGYGKGRFRDVKSGRSARPIELVAAIAEVDLRHAGDGDRARQYVLGANLRVNRHTRLAGQLQRLIVTDADDAVERGDGVQLRLQFDY